MKFFLTPAVYDALPAARRPALVAILNLFVALSAKAGECLAGQGWIADKLGVSIPTVRRLERLLERLHVIECDHHRRGNRRAVRVVWTSGPLAGLSGAGSSGSDAGPLFAQGRPITCRGSVETRSRGSRAHSTRRENENSDPGPAPRARGGLLARAFARLTEETGLWPRARGPAWRLATRIADERGERKAAAWLSWLSWHNGKSFDDRARRGAATWGALCAAAGEPLRRDRARAGPVAMREALAGLFP